MRKNVLYFLMIAGALLFSLNIWSADFESSEINFWSAGASLLMIVLGLVELKKLKKK
jgi:uncharacterized membrane protein YiaA